VIEAGLCGNDKGLKEMSNRRFKHLERKIKGMQKNVWGGRIKLSFALNVPVCNNRECYYEIPGACEQPIEEPHRAQHTCSVDAINSSLRTNKSRAAERKMEPTEKSALKIFMPVSVDLVSIEEDLLASRAWSRSGIKIQDPTLKVCPKRLKELLQNVEVESKRIKATENHAASQPTQGKI
jgi:hypothetical protein